MLYSYNSDLKHIISSFLRLFRAKTNFTTSIRWITGLSSSTLWRVRKWAFEPSDSPYWRCWSRDLARCVSVGCFFFFMLLFPLAPSTERRYFSLAYGNTTGTKPKQNRGIPAKLLLFLILFFKLWCKHARAAFLYISATALCARAPGCK